MLGVVRLLATLFGLLLIIAIVITAYFAISYFVLFLVSRIFPLVGGRRRR